MILGFDASTTTCGWAISDNKTVIDCGFIDISKLPTNKEKALHVIDVLKNHPHIGKITQINLEAALSGFAGGRTSQQVIIKLARFNAVFEYIISEYWKIPVVLLSVNTIRKKVFGKCRIKGMKSKEFVKAQLNNIITVGKWDKFKKNGNWDDRNYDMYDAIVTSMC
jgi:uncharacterized protein YunC (DUF1805 family)